MARTQGKGWFRTRKQCTGEFVLFCYYSQDLASGKRKEKFHKLGLVSQLDRKSTTSERWSIHLKSATEPENRARANSYFSATTPRISQAGNGRRNSTSLVSSPSSPTRQADGKKWAGSGSRRSLTIPFQQKSAASGS